MDPHTAEETEEAIELDMLNVLPDELDPKVTYREAVRRFFPPFFSDLSFQGQRELIGNSVSITARGDDPTRLHRRPRRLVRPPFFPLPSSSLTHFPSPHPAPTGTSSTSTATTTSGRIVGLCFRRSRRWRRRRTSRTRCAVFPFYSSSPFLSSCRHPSSLLLLSLSLARRYHGAAVSKETLISAND
jgi:hypothetical protein